MIDSMLEELEDEISDYLLGKLTLEFTDGIEHLAKQIKAELKK